MKQSSNTALFTCCISIAAIMICSLQTGCKQTSKTESKKSAIDSIPAFVLQKAQVSKQIVFPAEIMPFERAEILPKVSGYINAVKVDIGDRVQKGQVLIVLDAPEALSNYAQANSDVQAARAKYLGSLDTYKRILNASRVAGTVADSELEQARIRMQSDSSSYEASKSKLNTYGQLKDYLTIRSPYSGVVTQRNVDVGTLVGGNNQRPLLIIEDNSILRLRVAIPEAFTTAIPDTSVISFTVDAQPGINYKATLSRKSDALNLTNRTETWEYLYRNDHGELKSGMFANVVMKLGRKGLSFLVPSSAVSTNLEKRFVIRLRNDKTEWVDVRNGINIDTKVEIFGNLTEGDTLLVRATDEIKPDKQFIPKFQTK